MTLETVQPVRVGLVGVGRWGQQYVNAFNRAEGVALVALCANRPESAAEATAKWNLPCDADFASFIQRPELDAVIISSPNYTHYQLAKAALTAGKHVLLEKPMSFTTVECDELIALAKQQNRILYIGLEMRVFTLWERFKTLLDKGAIGQPRFGTSDLRRYPYSSGAGGWRYDPSKVGDWLLEEPIHYFDLMVWLMGPEAGAPNRLYAATSASRPEREVWHENFSSLLSFSNGGYVNISRTVASFHFRLQIRFTGTLGTLEGNWSAPTDRSPDPVASLTLFRFGDEAPQNIEVAQKTGHAHDLHRELTVFGQAVRGEQLPLVSGLDGRRSVYLCQAAAVSLASGQAITITDWQ